MPNLKGKRLTNAQAALDAAGVQTVNAVDGTGQGRVVIDPDNWVVTSQNPAAGVAVSGSTVATLKVIKPSDGQGAQGVKAGVVPNVVCKDLQSAQDTLQAAGFYNLGSEDGTGEGRMQILDRDWVVIGQSAKAGSKPSGGTRIVLRAVKFGEPTGRSGCRS